MAWMVGRNHYTVPTGRLDLGSKPNINIHTEKIYNNYGTGMPYGSIYGGGFGYGYGYGNYDTGLTKGEKWMLGIAGVATIGGAILSAFTGASKAEAPAEVDTSDFTAEQKAQLEELQDQQAAIAERHEKLVEENKELKERAKLYQEGITKNDDGTYTATVKNLFGKNETITASSADGVREAKKQKEEEINTQKDFCAANGITIGTDGQFSKTIKTASGEEQEITGATPEEVLQKSTLTDDTHDDNYLA